MSDNSKSASPQPLQPIPEVSAVSITPIQTKKHLRPFIWILLGIMLLGVGGIGGYLLAIKPTFIPNQTVCTMEVKICPDGSSVGRTGSKCDFTPCPTTAPDPTANWKMYTNSEYSFKYPDTWILENKKISSNDKSIEMWAFVTDDPMYNECMKLTNTRVVENVTVKSYSGVTTPEMCDPLNLNLKEKWIVKTDSEGYAPGLQYSYKSNDPVAETIFTQIFSTFKFVSTNSNRLPDIIGRNSKNNNYSSWSIYKDTRGYVFYYPASWFLSEGNGVASTISNWNPATVKNSGPLSGNQAKWDVNFSRQNFQNISEVLQKESEDMKIDAVEKSKTMHGQDIYFIQGTGSLFGNEDIRVPIIVAIVSDSANYYKWNGIYYGGPNNIEILKQIVESTGVAQ